MNIRLSSKLQSKWLENQILFLRPLVVFIGILYIGFLIPRIEENGISLQDFIPTNGVLTAIALYAGNAIYDYLRKLKGQ
jgi:hypothetical protein